MAKVLFLHGLDARPGGIKPAYLTRQGHTVLNPALPREDFEESVHIAQAELLEHAPDVVVGSSRGGAVALAMDLGSTPTILIAPAWKFFTGAPRIPPNLTILHSRQDHLIPFEHSLELVERWPSEGMTLIEAGHDHSMTDEGSLALLNEWVERLAMST